MKSSLGASLAAAASPWTAFPMSLQALTAAGFTVSHSPLHLLGVLAEALLQLAGVGGEPGPDVVGVLLHHGLKLLHVLVHLLSGLHHVLAQFVGQQLKVLAQAVGGLLGVGGQLGLQVVLVHGHLCHAVLDQGAVHGGGVSLEVFLHSFVTHRA